MPFRLFARHAKRAALEELGNIVLTMVKHGNLDESRIQAKSGAILEFDRLIRAKEAEGRQLHLKAQEAKGKQHYKGLCTCGAEIPESARFCGRCGTKLP